MTIHHNTIDAVRTTVNLDSAQLKEAERLTSVSNRSELIRRALNALIERESAKRLARLGGTEPDVTAAPRRRGGRSTSQGIET